MGSWWSVRTLTASTPGVYKGTMTFRIDTTFDVDPNSKANLNVGAYVRAVGEDMGTGLVVAVGESECLDEKTNKIHFQRVYHVHWLDMNEGTAYRFVAEDALMPSSRSVPKFTTPEEAEAWMEAQLQPGNWTGKAQDAVDSSSDLDVALQKMLEEGLGDDGYGTDNR